MGNHMDIPGSGSLRVTTARDVKRVLAKRVEPEPLEGTRMDLFNSVLPNFYAENVLFSFSTAASIYGTPDLASRVWVANR